MPSITATGDYSVTGVPVIRLELDWEGAEDVFVYRTDPDGSVIAVRQADPVQSFTGEATILDYEFPFSETVSYRMSSGSESYDSGPVIRWDEHEAWLVHPGLPDRSVALGVIEWPTWTAPVPRGVFRPLGRRAPIVVSGRRQAPSGSLVLYTKGTEAYDRLELLLDDGAPLLLKGTPNDGAGTTWVSVGDYSVQPVAVNVREFAVWTLPLDVASRPSGSALAPVRYADASLYFDSYLHAGAVAPTYADRSAGLWKV